MNLFRLGDFHLHSGKSSSWKIDCDALTPEDWDCLAKMASEVLPPFSSVSGVIRGGLQFADALLPYATKEPYGQNARLLIADDVLTTGKSMQKVREMHLAPDRIIGVVVFARGPCPSWVTPLFQVPLK